MLVPGPVAIKNFSRLRQKFFGGTSRGEGVSQQQQQQPKVQQKHYTIPCQPTQYCTKKDETDTTNLPNIFDQPVRMQKK